MSKVLVARKCKDEWLVEIKDTRYLKTKSEVLKLVKENGLKVAKVFGISGGIYAR